MKSAEEKIWTLVLRISAASLAAALVFMVMPGFGIARWKSGVWLGVSLVLFVVAKSQTLRWSEVDDLPFDD